jgi:hypothetical protein
MTSQEDKSTTNAEHSLNYKTLIKKVTENGDLVYLRHERHMQNGIITTRSKAVKNRARKTRRNRI